MHIYKEKNKKKLLFASANFQFCICLEDVEKKTFTVGDGDVLERIGQVTGNTPIFS